MHETKEDKLGWENFEVIMGKVPGRMDEIHRYSTTKLPRPHPCKYNHTINS